MKFYIVFILFAFILVGCTENNTEPKSDNSNYKMVKWWGSQYIDGEWHEKILGKIEYFSDGLISKKETYEFGFIVISETYEYDNNKNLVKTVHNEIDPSYDDYYIIYGYENGLLVVETQYKVNNKKLFETEYEYDGNGKLIKANKYLYLFEPERSLSEYFIYTYNSNGNLIRKDFYSSQDNLHYFIEYKYDSMNRIIETIGYGDEIYKEERTYNSSGLLSESKIFVDDLLTYKINYDYIY